jgi:HK97 family phage prohead protease
MGQKAKPDDGGITTGGSLKHGAEPDFSGYVTKANLKCSDGRTILPDAFKHQDKVTVPLVWQHNHDDPENVLGHAILENRSDGVYGYAYLNGTPKAKTAGELVAHKDIKSFSIYANQLTEKAKQVLHGWIREVSLVMAGANPGALIDNIAIRHGDGELETLEDEALIYFDEPLVHGAGEEVDESENSDDPEEETEVEHSADDPTIQEVYDGMDDDEKKVVHYMIGQALEEAKSKSDSAQHSAGDDESDNDDKEGKGRMSQRTNVFERNGATGSEEVEKHALSHDDVRGIVQDAIKMGSMKDAVEQYAVKHGIENLDVLFPDAKAVSQTPEFDSRRIEWVRGVINDTKKVPFSRIKNFWADITHEEARAKGYIKGTFKKEEWFGLAKRVTTPATIYKKQKLDRDDIIDIVDLDVVAWMKAEMRLMLDEELARAILIGDGRPFDDEDKIKDPAGANEGAGIRSIANDHDLYAATITLPVDLNSNTQNDVIDELLRSMRFYKGSGSPTFYTTLPMLTWLLLARDGQGRRYYRTAGDLAAELGVSNIVTVEVMEDEATLVGIIVNLKDYTLGADRGGDVAFFDDFDIDYNQLKYLIETRLSGALTKIRSALVIRRADAGDVEVAPAAPAFDGDSVTIVDQAGVVYRNAADNSVMNAAGSPYAVAAGDSITVTAEPDATHYFENNVEDEWTFENNG